MICKDHKRYKGVRKPTRDCKACLEVYYSKHPEENEERIIKKRAEISEEAIEKVDSVVPNEDESEPKVDYFPSRPPRGPKTETFIYNRFNSPLPVKIVGRDGFSLKPKCMHPLAEGDKLDSGTSKLIIQGLLYIIVRELE